MSQPRTKQHSCKLELPSSTIFGQAERIALDQVVIPPSLPILRGCKTAQEVRKRTLLPPVTRSRTSASAEYRAVC